MPPQANYQSSNLGERLNMSENETKSPFANLNPHARVFKASPRNDKNKTSQKAKKTDNLAKKYFESEQEA